MHTTNFNDWDPSHDNWRLTLIDTTKNLYAITIPKQKKNNVMYFKFTRGNGGSVEGDKAGFEIGNRRYELMSEGTTYFEIESWKDMLP